MKYKGCKHLNYDLSTYPQCKLCSLSDQGFPDVYYWNRSGGITEEELIKFPYTKTSVQFCRRHGRIGGIFDCIEPGEMVCYEPQEEEK